MKPKSLSVFFPMYNEYQNIEKVLTDAERIIPELGFSDYEILVIDDGSVDGCDKLVEARAAINDHIHLVRHPRNLGYGVALRTGFQEAQKEAVFYTDCDLPVNLREIERALDIIGHADLVIGYRIKRYETIRRAVYSRIYNYLMRILFNVHVKDVNFSYKLVTREVLNRINLTAKTVFIDGQLLAEASAYGFKYSEIPIEYIPRRFGSSNFDSIRTAWETLFEMLSYRWLKFINHRKMIREDRLTSYQ